MKKIMILPVSLLLMSCSFSSKSQNSEQALQDSIRVADSIAAVEAAAYEAEQAAAAAYDDEVQISNPLLALMVSIIQ